MNEELIDNPEPLQSNYLPSEFVDRDRERARLTEAVSDPDDAPLCNIHLSGPRGAGKTHLIRRVLNEVPNTVNTCYLSCIQNDSQYKALKQLYSAVSGEDVENGHHTSELQRRIENRTGHVPAVVVLDDIEFLLLNDGDDLLYYLSRLDANIGVVVISSTDTKLRSELEERTYSSLQPRSMVLKPYEPEQVYDILADRARAALKPESLHREALTYIGSRTQNIAIGLRWLRTAAENATDPLTVEVIEEAQSTAYRRYVDSQLDAFTSHHKLLFQALVELTAEDSNTIQTGAVYDRYEDLCNTYSENSLTDRRTSDFLKQLELLNLIDADYHYGGQKGKTRELEVKEFYEQLVDLT